VQTLKLKAGVAGSASVLVKAKGELTDVPPLPLTGPVLVQLSAEGAACFEAELQPGGFIKNDAEQFKAQGGAPVP
jgi:hypothetical protein